MPLRVIPTSPTGPFLMRQWVQLEDESIAANTHFNTDIVIEKDKMNKVCRDTDAQLQKYQPSVKRVLVWNPDKKKKTTTTKHQSSLVFCSAGISRVLFFSISSVSSVAKNARHLIVVACFYSQVLLVAEFKKDELDLDNCDPLNKKNKNPTFLLNFLLAVLLKTGGRFLIQNH